MIRLNCRVMIFDLFHRILDAPPERLQYFDAGEILAVGLYQRSGCDLAARNIGTSLS